MTVDIGYRGRAAAVMLSLITVAAPGAARADVLILDSNVSSLKRGAQVSDDARLMIPAGKSVMIMRPSGETQEVSGPYDRKVQELSRGETVSESFTRMKSMLEQEAGGKRPGSSIGASRGITK